MNKILLIEDDPLLRENTAELLELAGFNVITASDGQEGLKFAREHVPDLIICDVKMPKMDGFEVLNNLQNIEATINIPFIFCTASVQRDEVDRGNNSRAMAYVVKPYEEETLLKTIDRIIGGRA